MLSKTTLLVLAPFPLELQMIPNGVGVSWSIRGRDLPVDAGSIGRRVVDGKNVPCLIDAAESRNIVGRAQGIRIGATYGNDNRDRAGVSRRGTRV
jgi:hypothetical protein